MMKKASYGRVVSPSTSLLGIIMRGAKTSCRLATDADEDRRPDRCRAIFLQAIERIGYRMPDFSSLKIEALFEHSLDVPRVSERYVTFNLMDVVRHLV
jgi:hypothetical protein